MNVYVRHLINNNGNAVKNQFRIYDGNEDAVTFQSYNSRVCIIEWVRTEFGQYKKVTFGRDYDYSTTTAKYLNMFLNDEGIDLKNRDDIRKAIKRGSCTDWKAQNVVVCYDADLR